MDEKATQLHAIASLKVLLDATKPHNGSSSSAAANHVTLTSQLSQETRLATSDQPNGIATGIEEGGDPVSTSITKNFFKKRGFRFFILFLNLCRL